MELRKKLFKLLARADLWLLKKIESYSMKDDFGILTPILKRLATLLFILLVVFILGWCVYWILYVGPKPDITDPALQVTHPEVMPSPTPREIGNRWDEHDWLTQSEALELRQQDNVVNLALLENGALLYSRNTSVILDQEYPWQVDNPFGVTNISVEGTVVQLVASGSNYTLNLYQPFVLVSTPDYVHVIDSDGLLWTASLDDTGVLDDIGNVRDNLPIVIAPNENLSASYWRR